MQSCDWGQLRKIIATTGLAVSWQYCSGWLGDGYIDVHSCGFQYFCIFELVHNKKKTNKQVAFNFKVTLLQEAITDGLEIVVSPRSLHSELMCPICLDMLKNTMTTKECLHRFCADCIITALRSGYVEMSYTRYLNCTRTVLCVLRNTFQVYIWELKIFLKSGF